MANLPENSVWQEVYEIALTDDVVGGAAGAANVQAQNLVNRTKFLADNKANKTETYERDYIDDVQANLQAVIDANAANIAANLALINAQAGTIVTHTSQIAALDLRITANENDIISLENADAALDIRLDTLEADTGWLNGLRTNAAIDVATFLCKVRQKGGIVYVTGQFKFNSSPAVGETLITFPASIGIPSEKWYFTSGDSAADEVNELYAYNFNRFISLAAAASTGTVNTFSTSYPVN